MDPFLAVVSLAAVTYTLANLLKSVLGAARGDTDWNTAVTIVAVVLLAWGALMLYGASTWGAQTVIGDKALADLSVLDKLVAAIAVGGVGSVLYDFVNRREGYVKLLRRGARGAPPPQG